MPKTEAEMKAQKKYIDSRVRLEIVLTPEENNQVREAAEKEGLPVARYIKKKLGFPERK